jgi:hypothetical protein
VDQLIALLRQRLTEHAAHLTTLVAIVVACFFEVGERVFGTCSRLLKPDDISCTPAAAIIVGDFGWARLLHEESDAYQRWRALVGEGYLAGESSRDPKEETATHCMHPSAVERFATQTRYALVTLHAHKGEEERA